MPDRTVSFADVCSVLDAVAELPAAARDAYFAALSDPALRREALAYLAYESTFVTALDGLEAAGPSLLEQVLQPPAHEAWPPPGTMAGPYRLVRLAGQGGYGAVYEAVDAEADRTVALKLLAARHADVPVRLRREIRALARLDHPHVARFFAAGTADDGRPFFAMEWVDGTPVDAYTEAHALPLDARAALLEQVCAAVQHAHERFVLHRDLKPANVLVAATSSGPEAKVVDFGIGKLLDDETPRDEVAPYLRLTPHYAAPEQLRGDPATVASDVFSLGALAREVLFAEERPATPLAEDLRAVVAKALNADPAQRYPTAAALQDDLARARTRRVTAARPVPGWERTRRYVQRHARQVALATVALLVLAGAAAAYVASIRDARARADREAAAAEEAVAMLTTVFDTADPFSDQTDTLRVRNVVAEAAQSFRADPPASPQVRARVACTLAGVYTSLEDPAALPFFDLCLVRPDGPLAPPWYQQALLARARLARNAGDAQAAYRFGRMALAEAERAGLESAASADALVALGETHALVSRFDSAAAVLERGVALTRQRHGAQSAQAAAALSARANALMRLGRFDEAEASARAAVTVETQVRGARHPLVALRLSTLGTLYNNADRIAEADSVLRRAYALFTTALGPSHPSTMDVEAVLAENRRLGGDSEGAYADYLNLYPRYAARLGADNPRVLRMCASVGFVERRAGRIEDAVRRLEECAARADRVLGPYREATLYLHSALGFALYDARRFADCEAAFRALVPRFEHVLRDHPYVWQTHVAVGNCAIAQERGDVAEREARIALEGLVRTVPPDNRVRFGAEGLLGRALSVQHRWDEADSVLSARVATAQRYALLKEDLDAARGDLDGMRGTRAYFARKADSARAAARR